MQPRNAPSLLLTNGVPSHTLSLPRQSTLKENDQGSPQDPEVVLGWTPRKRDIHDPPDIPLVMYTSGSTIQEFLASFAFDESE
jgi:hypothetical protein